MSVDVDELIKKIAAEVTKQVLAVMQPKPADDWPEWDEFNQVEPDVPVVSGPSVLRSRLNGAVDLVEDDDDDDVIEAGVNTGNVTPLKLDTFDNRRGGFDPRSNPGWFDVQYQREVVLPSRAAPR